MKLHAKFLAQVALITFGGLFLSARCTIEPSVKHSSYVVQLKDRLSRIFFYSKEQKAEAGEKLKQLLLDKEQLVDERAQGVSPERLREINAELKVVDAAIYEQKVILGHKWSMKKRVAALAGLVGIGTLGVYGWRNGSRDIRNNGIENIDVFDFELPQFTFLGVQDIKAGYLEEYVSKEPGGVYFESNGFYIKNLYRSGDMLMEFRCSGMKSDVCETKELEKDKIYMFRFKDKDGHWDNRSNDFRLEYRKFDDGGSEALYWFLRGPRYTYLARFKNGKWEFNEKFKTLFVESGADEGKTIFADFAR